MHLNGASPYEKEKKAGCTGKKTLLYFTLGLLCMVISREVKVRAEMENPQEDYGIGKCGVLEQNKSWGSRCFFMDGVLCVEKVE